MFTKRKTRWNISKNVFDHFGTTVRRARMKSLESSEAGCLDIIRQCIDGISKYIQRSINDLRTNSIAFRILCDSISLKISKLDPQWVVREQRCACKVLHQWCFLRGSLRRCQPMIWFGSFFKCCDHRTKNFPLPNERRFSNAWLKSLDLS